MPTPMGRFPVYVPDTKGAFAIPTPPEYPKLHTLCLVVAKRGAGKSTAVCSLIRDLLQARLLDRVFVMSPTCGSNQALYATVRVAPDDSYDQPGDKALQAVVKKVEEEARVRAQEGEVGPPPAPTARPARRPGRHPAGAHGGPGQLRPAAAVQVRARAAPGAAGGRLPGHQALLHRLQQLVRPPVHQAPARGRGPGHERLHPVRPELREPRRLQPLHPPERHAPDALPGAGRRGDGEDCGGGVGRAVEPGGLPARPSVCGQPGPARFSLR